MNDFNEREFFHEGMRHFQDIFDGRRTAEAIEKIENIMNFGIMKKILSKILIFFYSKFME